MTTETPMAGKPAFFTGQTVRISGGLGRIVRKQGATGYMVSYSAPRTINVAGFAERPRLETVMVTHTSFFRTESIAPYHGDTP